MNKCCTMLLILSTLFIYSCGEHGNKASYHHPDFDTSYRLAKSPKIDASNFKFKVANGEVIESSVFKKELKKVAGFLQENQNKNLVITGKFGVSEVGTERYDSVNLGFVRAKSVKKHFLNYGISERQIVLQSKEYKELPLAGVYIEGIGLDIESPVNGHDGASVRAIFTKE